MFYYTTNSRSCIVPKKRKNAPKSYSERLVQFLNVCLCRFRPLTRNLFPCLLQFLHSPQFVLCVLKSEMGICVHRDPDFAMTHKVLQCLWVHSRFSHIAAIGVAADVRRYAWHLQAVNLVVPIHHIL